MHVPVEGGRVALPEKYRAGLHVYSERLMGRAAFRFELGQLPVVGAELLASLEIQGVGVLCVAVMVEHCHLLVQCVDDVPRACSGKLKAHVYDKMFKGSASPWGKRSHELGIRDRAHGVRVLEYIVGHREEGGWVWSYRDGGRGGCAGGSGGGGSR